MLWDLYAIYMNLLSFKAPFLRLLFLSSVPYSFTRNGNLWQSFYDVIICSKMFNSPALFVALKDCRSHAEKKRRWRQVVLLSLEHMNELQSRLVGILNDTKETRPTSYSNVSVVKFMCSWKFNFERTRKTSPSIINLYKFVYLECLRREDFLVRASPEMSHTFGFKNRTHKFS